MAVVEEKRFLFKIKQSIRFGHYLDSNSVIEGKLLGSYFVKEREREREKASIFTNM